MRNIWRQAVTSFVLLVVFPMPVWADEVAGLYEAEVPVFSQKREEREMAMETAFVQVLERVSGRTAIADLPGMADSLSQSRRFVQQYRYRKVDRQALPGDPKKKYEQVLWVRFDERAINKLLREQGLPVWSKTRPATLVWLALDVGGRRIIVSNDSDHDVRGVLTSSAQQRGLPLRLPLYDLQDRSALRVSDVWGNFEDAILNASRRYQTKAVLSGRVYQGFGGVWHGRWSLYSGGQRDDWEFRSTELMDVVRPSIDHVAEALSVRFAGVRQEQESNTVLVLVKDIQSLADFNRVFDYLSSLSGVERAQPAAIEANDAVFELLARNGRLGVAQAISLGYVLANEPTEPPPTTPVVSGPDPTVADTNAKPVPNLIPDLVYRLVP